MTRIALIGPGAIGGTAGFALADKHDLVICAHQKFAMLAITRADIKERRSHPVKVVKSPASTHSAGACVCAVQRSVSAATGRASRRPRMILRSRAVSTRH